jgi:hypothetical protein
MIERTPDGNFLEKRLFTAPMDFDDEDRLIPDNWTRKAIDVCILSAEAGNIGAAETKRGNSLIPYPLPPGRNKCIGWYEDKTNAKGYQFNWNELGQHHILEYDRVNGLSLVRQSPVLNFDVNHLITGINVLDGILFWVHDLNNPRAINIADSKAGLFPVTDTSITNTVVPPLRQPDVSIATDPSVNRNNIRNSIYQFSYSYTDKYFRRSAASPISQMVAAVGNEFTNNGQYYADYLNNNRIDIVLETGPEVVRQINVYVRQDNTGLFYLIETLNKFDTAGNVLIPSNTTLTYAFYNDRQLQLVDAAYMEKLFDNLPQQAKAQEIIEGQRLTYGNYVEGFDPIDIDVDFSIIRKDVSDQFINGGFSGNFTYNINGNSNTFTATVTTYLAVIVSQPAGATYSFQSGDVIVLLGANPGTGTYTQQTVEYIITSADVQGTLLQQTTAILTGLKAAIDAQPQPTPYSRSVSIFPAANNIQVNYSGPYNSSPGFFYELFLGYGARLVYRSIQKVGSFKEGADHPFGMVYYDALNRSTTTFKNAQTVVNVPFIGTNGMNYGSAVNISWAVKHLPPAYATHWQWVYTKNVSKDFVLQVALADVSPDPVIQQDNNGNSFFYITPLKTYQTDRPNTILAYDWTKGDRVTFILKDPAPTPAPIQVDVEILAYDPAASGGLKVTVQNIASIGFTVSPGALVEIYTPRPKTEESIFYEFSQWFPVLTEASSGIKYHGGETQDQDPNNPAGVPAEGVFTRGDTWVRYREYRYGDAVMHPTFVQSYVVEDYNYSDFYDSIDWDRGRPNKYDPYARRTRRAQNIRYSDIFIQGTNINGLSSFPDLNFNQDDYGSSYGSIQKLFNKDRRLHVFMEQRVGWVGILQRTGVTDAGAVTYQTDDVLNPIDYYAGLWGIGTNPESFCFFGNNMFFADAPNGEWLQLGGDGLTPISNYKQGNFFTNAFADLLATGTTPKVYAAYDTRYGEMVGSAEDTNNVPGFTIAFSPDNNGWPVHYNFRPDFMGSFGLDIVSFKDGALWLHNSGNAYANWYGVQYRPEVWVVFNGAPTTMKFFKALTVEADKYWEMYEATTQSGQKTSLQFSDWEQKENVWYAPLLMDENTPNVALPILDGDPMRAQVITCKFRYTGNDYSKLFSVGMLSATSERTNK